MFVLIAGGGRTGTQLAMTLLAQNHQVRVVEHRRDVLARIHHELPTEVIYEGVPTDPEVLERAGIRRVEAMAAVTTSDADNLTLCFLARELYDVPRTIARVNNPRAAWLFDQRFHVDVAVNQAGIMSSLIEEEISLGDMMTLLKLRRGQYSLVEEKIPAGARAIGIAIKDLKLPDQCVIAAIIRKGQIVIPRGVTQLEVGDEVLAVVGRDAADDLAALFARPGPAGNNRR
ncbi:MAG: TrkA family potassium uptake protein [Chloroflexi bacterium]|nr:TrkA family potassium uptake protein [Chloroflexota bacterium]